jgi:SAM-dependent methyltransferase
VSNNIEWLKIDEKELSYHTAQYNEPKEYTRYLLGQYEDFFKSMARGSKILDFGCGAGAATNQFAAAFPHLTFIGIDINERYIAIANELKRENSSFVCDDIEHFGTSGKLEGIISLQTLSWMPDYSVFLNAIKKLQPEWVLVTSLFYDGPVDALIKIRDHGRTMEEIPYRESYYNIYSIPQFEKALRENGFSISEYLPFHIGIDIPRKEGETGMATYTTKMEDGRRLQISGPLLMNWHTLLIKRHI